ncbi:MAG TPA: sigma-70 family RNA polymerase sigma factor [Bryobacteraceae bacterium]|nr:sigma-70 family RNA polymerase sigma factor [Bryobacteraceae bacterium]
MEEANAQDITQKLLQWGKGDRESLNELALQVEDELRRIARKHMRRERPGHTLQTTALLNEAYLRLINQTQVDWRDRAHFFGIAAHLMRQILVDYARRAGREKRGGAVCILPLDEGLAFPAEKSEELVALDEALERLAIKDPRKARVVELRYFGGLSVEETAEVLQVHPNTVIRDWTLVRAWLRRELGAKA